MKCRNQGKTRKQRRDSEIFAGFGIGGFGFMVLILLLITILTGCDGSINRALGGADVEVPVLNESCATAEIAGPDNKLLAVLEPGESTNLKFRRSFKKNTGGMYLVAKAVSLSSKDCRDEVGEIDKEYIDFDSGDYDIDRWEINF